jgi:hypothetical protein
MVQLFWLSPTSKVSEESVSVCIIRNGLHEFNDATLDPPGDCFRFGERMMDSRCRGTRQMRLLRPATRNGAMWIFLLHGRLLPEY